MIRAERVERWFMRVEMEERVAWLFQNVASHPPDYMMYPRRTQSGKFCFLLLFVLQIVFCVFL